MPAKAGIQNYLKTLDSRLRGNDAKGRFKTFYETINIRRSMLDVRCSTFASIRCYGQAESHTRISHLWYLTPDTLFVPSCLSG